MAFGMLKGYGGTEIHGWLFNWLKEIAPDLSSSIHDMDEKPFVIGPVNGGKKERGKIFLDENSEYSFSLASLNQEMYKVLEMISKELKGTKIQLGSGKLLCTEIIPIFGENGLTYFDLLEKNEISSEITLEFRSPTSFRQQGIQEVFPLPNLVFGSILRKWNSFSPVVLTDGVLNTKIFVSKYKLKTELVDYSIYKIVGCVGNCSYIIDKSEPSHKKRMLHSLAAFADIAAIGYKTSMGLGDSRYILEKRR